MQSIWILCSLTAFAAVGQAINCYSCESTYEPDCGDDFELANYWKLDCSRVSPPRFLLPDLPARNSTACMKKIYEEAGQRRVVRSCFFGDVNATEVGCRTDPSLAAVKEVACLVCDDENYCNAATAPPSEGRPWSALTASVVFVLVARLLSAGI